MLRDSLKQLEVTADVCDRGVPSGAASQHLVTPFAAAAGHTKAEHSENSTISGSSSQQQQQLQQQNGHLVQSPESQQSYLVPLLHQLGQTTAGDLPSHRAQQQPAALFDEQTEPCQIYSHCAPAAGCGAGGDLSGDTVMKSNYRGLTWDKKDGRWRVRIHFMGKQHHIGRFADEEEAARHFDSAAYYLFGDRAVTNFGVAAAASNDIPISSSIKALLSTNISSGDAAKSDAAVPGRRWHLGAAAAAAAAAGGPATVSRPVQPPTPYHSTQRQLQRQLPRQLQLPYPSNDIMPQKTVDGSDSQQQQQQQAMHLIQSHDTANELTTEQNDYKASGASSPQPEQQQQQQATRWPDLLLPSGITAATARPTPARLLSLQTHTSYQQQQHDWGDGMLDSPLVNKPHWLVSQLQQTLDSHNTDPGLNRRDHLWLPQPSMSAPVTETQLHTTAESSEAALDLTALAAAATAEQAAGQWQRRHPQQHQQSAGPCVVPTVMDTAIAADGRIVEPSEEVAAVLGPLIQLLDPDIINRPTTNPAQPPRQDTMSELFQAILGLQQQPPDGPLTVAAGRAAISAAACQNPGGTGTASHAELALQSDMTPAATGGGPGGRSTSGAMTDAQLVEDRLLSDLMQLHQQQQQLCHCDSSTAAGQSQLMQLKREKLRLILVWQQQLQRQLQQEQQQPLQVLAPGAGTKLLQLPSIDKGNCSSPRIAGGTSLPVVSAASTSPVVSAGGVVPSESSLLSALECLVSPGKSSRRETGTNLVGRKRNASDSTLPPSTASALTAAWAVLQHNGGGHASTSNRDRSGRVQTAPKAASLREPDFVQQLLSNMQRIKTPHPAPHTGAAAAIAAANAAVAAAAAPEGFAASRARSALQPAPSHETGFESGPAGPEAKRQRSSSSTDDIMAQLLAVVHLLGATEQAPARPTA